VDLNNYVEATGRSSMVAGFFTDCLVFAGLDQADTLIVLFMAQWSPSYTSKG